MEEATLSLFDVSTRLGVSPSAVKKRVSHLNIPVQRGARGKLIFDRHAYALLARADALLKAGAGFEDCRRELGLEAPAAEASPLEAPTAAAQAFVPMAVAPAASAVAPVRASRAVSLRAGGVPVEGAKLRPLVPPVFIQLGRRKPGAAESGPIEPDLLARLDATLRLLEEKDRQNQTLQSKILVACDEISRLNATAAAFQERSQNLQHEVIRLQSEVKLLAPPPQTKPWWKFWSAD